jgi:hypothetical protein
MTDSIHKYLNKCIWVAVGITLLRIVVAPKISTILAVNSAYDFFGCAGEGIGIAAVFMTLYERVLWRCIPFESTPRIGGIYSGRIKYRYNGGGSKSITATVKQSLLSVTVCVSTNEIASHSTSCTIMDDGSETVLFYTYMTMPKSQYSANNPIVYGACRLSLATKGKLNGIYWTSGGTYGDIELTKK